MTLERVYRWEIGLVAALILGAFGVLLSDVVALVAAMIPLSYIVVGALNRIPESPRLTADRTLDTDLPAPGDEVTVELTLENRDDAVFSDIRVIDVVPDGLTVIDGSPRACLALRPGESATVEYTVVARQGAHSFGDPYVRMRTLTGTRRLTATVSLERPTTLDCRTHGVEGPFIAANRLRTGDIATDTPGHGLEFYATREYQPGDAINRIDWRRFGKTGDLTTIEYREQRAATVMLVVDARATAQVTPYPGHPDGIELATYAAAQTFETLTAAGHRTGFTTLGFDGNKVATTVQLDRLNNPWIPPHTDAETTARVSAVTDAILESAGASASTTAFGAATNRAATPAPDGGSRLATRLRSRLSSDTQVVICSPMTDDSLLPVIRELRMAGYGVSVVSPNLTGGSGHGATIATLDRQHRLDRARGTGAVVIDWEPNTPLEAALTDRLGVLI